jgi:nitrate/nitrite-specific signal transduction histidine kinase
VFFLALVLLNIIVASVSSIFIIEPMQQLTQTANDITATHDYSLRTNLNSLDEIGKLANTLNELVSTA